MPAPRADNAVKNFKFAKEWKSTEKKVIVLVHVSAKSQSKAEEIVEKELGWLQDPHITRSEIAHINKNPSETDDHCPTCTCNK